MASNPNQELDGTVARLHQELDAAVDRTVELRRDGAHEDVVLTETVLAVRAAQALEGLTGVSWDERLEEKLGAAETEADAEPAPGPDAPRPGRRGLRRLRRSPTG